MPSRRQFLAQGCAAALGLAFVPRVGSQQDGPKVPDGSAAKDMITPEAQKAIDKGLAYLAGRQQGSGAFGHHQYNGNVAITSLAALAMMSGGHQPGRGPYGGVVEKALQYVLNADDGRGYLLGRTGMSHGPMYGHGFGTLFLAEVHGMVHQREQREQLRSTLKQAVNLIITSQNKSGAHEGGWRYQPGSPDADLSVTVCQIMALRAARNAGFSVPKSTVDKCTQYVKRCQNLREGGFRYQTTLGPAQFARSAAGLVALNCAGIYKGEEVDSALKYLMHFKPKDRQPPPPDVHLHYYYGHYYAAQAMWTAGGKYWAEWYPAIRDELLGSPDHERELGAWRDHRFGDDYGTAMACIILQIPNNYLPILQK
jgi:hypothetical protein